MGVGQHLRAVDRRFGDFYDRRVAQTSGGQALRRYAEPSFPGEGRGLRVGLLVFGLVNALLLIVVALILVNQGERAAWWLVAGAVAVILASPLWVRLMRRRGRW
jgi:hypothetical protein